MMRTIVTAVEERREGVAYLERHIPRLEVVWDQTRNAMDTFLRAWAEVREDAVLSVQDDVCLTVDFMEKALVEITARPEDVMTFFSRTKDDLTIGSRYRSGGQWMGNCAYYLPSGVAAGILDFALSPTGPEQTQRFVEFVTADDLLMAKYLQLTKRRYWVVVPSLVQHPQIRSVIGPARSRFRQSPTFVDPELDGYPWKEWVIYEHDGEVHSGGRQARRGECPAGGGHPGGSRPEVAGED